MPAMGQLRKDIMDIIYHKFVEIPSSKPGVSGVVTIEFSANKILEILKPKTPIVELSDNYKKSVWNTLGNLQIAGYLTKIKKGNYKPAEKLIKYFHKENSYKPILITKTIQKQIKEIEQLKSNEQPKPENNNCTDKDKISYEDVGKAIIRRIKELERLLIEKEKVIATFQNNESSLKKTLCEKHKVIEKLNAEITRLSQERKPNNTTFKLEELIQDKPHNK